MSDFSHDGFSLHPELRDKRKPISTEWLRGPKITKENLKNGTGCVELMDRPEWVKFPNGAKSSVSGAAAKPAQNAAAMTFGKYRGRLLVDILEENPGYLKWAKSEINGFAKKLEQAGIEIDE